MKFSLITAMDEENTPYKPTTESRFIVEPVEHNELDDVNDDANSLADLEFRSRLNTDASQITHSDLSRLGILSSLGDAGKFKRSLQRMHSCKCLLAHLRFVVKCYAINIDLNMNFRNTSIENFDSRSCNMVTCHTMQTG